MKKTWPQVKLAEILKLCDNSVPVTELQEIKLAGVYSFARGLFQRGPINPATTTYTCYNRLVTDDFVISQPKAWEGAFARITPEFDGWFLSPVFPTFRANRGILEPAYLEWFYRQSTVWAELQRKSRGLGARRESVSPEQFLSLSIPLPSLTEQSRIVARIEELSAKIEEARSLRKQGIEEAEAFFISTRTGLFEEAANSRTVTMDRVGILERGKFSHRPRNDPRFFGGQHPWIQIAEIEAANKWITKWSETLNNDGLAISRKFPKGTVLVSIAATIGAVGILDFDCCFPDSIVAITPKPDADSEFIYHYVGYVRSHLEQIAPQSAQKNINLQILSSLPVPSLSLNEQRRIVAYLDGLQAKVDALKKLQEDSAAELNALMPSILSRAFKGGL